MPNANVLIVDDNPVNARLASITLEMAGYAVQIASDADEAMLLLDGELPDLVLMDVQLPGMDGLELTRHLRGGPATAGLRIVAMTSYAMRGDAERTIDAGCDGYIAKPIDTRTFAGVVASYLPATAGRE